MKDTSRKEYSVFVDLEATCQVYEFETPLFSTISSTDDFRTATKHILDGNLDWTTLFNYFGTHIVYKAIMGGRVTIQRKIKSTAYQEIKSRGIDVKSAAKFVFVAWSTDTSIDYSSHKKTIETLEKRTEYTREIYVGGKPNRKGYLIDWHETEQRNLAPISYSVEILSILFNS